jgi:antitoxin ParD1/3/4
MKVRGIKRGQNIEILEQLNNIPDGTEIIVDLEIVDLEFIENQIRKTKQPLTEQERLAKLNKLFGTWKNQPELTQIFAEIDQERHTYQGRIIDSIDNQDND